MEDNARPNVTRFIRFWFILRYVFLLANFIPLFWEAFFLCSGLLICFSRSRYQHLIHHLSNPTMSKRSQSFLRKKAFPCVVSDQKFMKSVQKSIYQYLNVFMVFKNPKISVSGFGKILCFRKGTYKFLHRNRVVEFGWTSLDEIYHFLFNFNLKLSEVRFVLINNIWKPKTVVKVELKIFFYSFKISKNVTLQAGRFERIYCSNMRI